MKLLSELSPDELQALKAGDVVYTRAERGPEFRVIFVDAVNILGAYPASVVISLQRVEPREITTTSTVVTSGPLGLNIAQTNVAAQPAAVEEAQLRMTPEVASDVVLSLILNLLAGAPEVLDAKLRSNPAAQEALAAYAHAPA